MTVAANLARIRESFGNYQVTLIAVSKYVGIKEMIEAFECGVTEFGENRVQDAIEKQKAMPPHVARHIHWHFIGHLQSNKVKKALGRFALIHSIDSKSLAEELSKEAAKKGVVQKVLLQVKMAEDPGKSGFTPESLKSCFAEMAKLPGIKIEGLMTMTPLTADSALREKCFLALSRLREELQDKHGVQLNELSMGMSDDYREALKYGATMVRVGRAIFQKSEN